MTAKIIKTNYLNQNLYCFYSKEKIHIGERYVLTYERYKGEWIEKTYKYEFKDYIDEE